MSDYQLIVIGAGPGGYTAALQAAKRGLRTAVVERREVGGTCLNRGCIPTKTLLNGAKNYLHAKEAGQFGVDATGVTLDWGRLQDWKEKVVKGLVSGVAATEKRAGVTVVCASHKALTVPRAQLREIILSTPGSMAVDTEIRASASSPAAAGLSKRCSAA